MLGTEIIDGAVESASEMRTIRSFKGDKVKGQGTVLGVDVEDGSVATKSVIPRSEVDMTNAYKYIPLIRNVVSNKPA